MNSNVLIATSSIADGSMSAGVDMEQKITHRKLFLAAYGITLEQSVLVYLTYDGDEYKRYYTIGVDQAGDGMQANSTIIADALFTRDKNVALFLPVADCVAAVLYDPVHGVIGLSHLGRHNLSQQGGASSVRYMVNEFGTEPSQLQVWLSPAAGRGNYPLFDFGSRSLHEICTMQLSASGVDIGNITIDSRDTTTDSSLFSHSEFLKGNRTQDGRQAVVAMIRS